MGVLLSAESIKRGKAWHAQEDPRRSYVTGERELPGLTNVDSVFSRRSIETVGSASQPDVIHEYEIGLSVEAASFASLDVVRLGGEPGGGKTLHSTEKFS